MGYKELIWLFRLNMATQSRMVMDGMLASDKITIPAASIRTGMKTLAELYGLSGEVTTVFGSDCLWFSNAQGTGSLSIEVASRRPVGSQPIDFPVISKGVDFNLEFAITLDKADEKRIIAGLAGLLELMRKHGLRVGGLQSRGFGRLGLKALQVGRYETDSKAGIREYLQKMLSDPSDQPVELLNSLVTDLDLSVGKGKTAVFSLELKPVQGIVLPSVNAKYIPGTLVAGVLRRHALKLAQVFGNDGSMVDDIFGVKGKPSLVQFDDIRIHGGKHSTIKRLAIDHFTGWTIGKQGFEYLVVGNCTLYGSIRLEQATAKRIGFLSFLLRELISGRISLGALGAVGFGLCSGKVTIETGTSKAYFDHNTAEGMDGYVQAIRGTSGN